MRWMTLAAALALWTLPAPALAREEGPPTERPAWAFALYLDTYLGGASGGYLVPTVFADRAPLHLEARYNYEDIGTASLHVGYTFPFGGEDAYVKLTPMIGAVFGNTHGIAPGAEVEARWGRVAYWLEAEYLLDTANRSGTDDYLYTWSELNVFLVPWLWVGGSVQRLKLEATPTEVDVGPMVGFGQPGSPGWSLSFYAYGLAREEPWWLGTLAVTF